MAEDKDATEAREESFGYGGWVLGLVLALVACGLVGCVVLKWVVCEMGWDPYCAPLF